MKTDNFVHGMTAPQDFQLVTVDANGTETPFDATAGGGVTAVYTVTLVLTNALTAAVVDTVGDVAWLTPVIGRVRYTPDATDLVGSATGTLYNARWKVVDAGSGVAYFPDGVADRWIVRL